MNNWVFNPRQGNYRLHGDGFFISYHPSNPERGEPETAIVHPDGKYYILIGDWRVDYQRVFGGGLDACMKLYNENPEFKSPLSSDGEVKTMDDLLMQLQCMDVVFKAFDPLGRRTSLDEDEED